MVQKHLEMIRRIMNNLKFQPQASRPLRDNIEQILEEAKALRAADVDPSPLVTASFIDGDGFELGAEIRKDRHSLALLQISAKKSRRPAEVPPDRAINLGLHPEQGFPVQLDINETGNILIIAPTKKGKNITARVIARDYLRLGKRFHVIAQKGDELNEVNLTTNSIYLPYQLNPWNDLDPIGSDSMAFWESTGDAFSIPKAIAPQTQPEIPLILEQMYRSAPHFCWEDAQEIFRWKSEQPGGRDKHATLAGAFAAYAAWLGPRARVRRSHDIRREYRHVIESVIGATFDNIEVAVGLFVTREVFEAKIRGHSRQPRLAIFFPEAQVLYDKALEYARRGHFSFLLRALAMVNSMGITFILALQSPSRFSDFAVANAATIIALCQDSFTEARFCARLLGLGDEAVPKLMSLPLGVAIVKTPGLNAPVEVRVTHIELGPPLTQADMDARFASEYRRMQSLAVYADPAVTSSGINWQDILGNKTADADRQSKPARSLHQDHYNLALEFQLHPLDGLRAHYLRLKWSVERGNRILADLKADGYITIHREKSTPGQTGRPKLIAHLTVAGTEFIKGHEARK